MLSIITNNPIVNVDMRKALVAFGRVVGGYHAGKQEFRDYEQGTPSDTAELVQDTYDDYVDPHVDFILEQSAQEVAAYVYKVALPLPLKLGIEVYGIYDYFN